MRTLQLAERVTHHGIDGRTLGNVGQQSNAHPIRRPTNEGRAENPQPQLGHDQPGEIPDLPDAVLNRENDRLRTLRLGDEAHPRRRLGNVPVGETGEHLAPIVEGSLERLAIE